MRINQKVRHTAHTQKTKQKPGLISRCDGREIVGSWGPTIENSVVRFKFCADLIQDTAKDSGYKLS